MKSRIGEEAEWIRGVMRRWSNAESMGGAKGDIIYNNLIRTAAILSITTRFYSKERRGGGNRGLMWRRSGLGG